MRISRLYKNLMIAALAGMLGAIPLSARTYNYHPGQLSMVGDWTFEGEGSYINTIFSYSIANNRILINNKYGGAVYQHRLAYTWTAPEGEVIVAVNCDWSRYGYLQNYPNGNYWNIAWYASSDPDAAIGAMDVAWTSSASTSSSRIQTFTVDEGVTKIGLGSLSTASDSNHEVAFSYITVTTEVLYETCPQETYHIPGNFADWTGNPMAPWTAAYAAHDWTAAGDWTPMVAGAHGGYDVFKHPTLSFPSFGRYNNYWWVSGRDDASWGYAAGALIFECPADGAYSVNTDWAIYGAGGDAITEHIRVHLALDSQSPPTVLWERSVSIPYGSQGVWHNDLSGAPALQDMQLPAGARLIFEMTADIAPGYPSAINKFLSTTSGTIGGYIRQVSRVDYDISGPGGVKDCRVDLYDFAALAASWMDCINPNYIECAVDVIP